jgi:acyl carrier protein
MDTREKLRGVFERYFNMPLPEFSSDMAPGSLQEWDSVAHLSLILEIEREFGVQFSTEELGTLADVGSIERTLGLRLPA